MKVFIVGILTFSLLHNIIEATFVFPFIPSFGASFHSPKSGTFCALTNNKCNLFQKYRTLDGSCNNLLKPWIGMKGTPLKRLLPAHYSDANGSIRSRSVDGTELPNPRSISLKVHYPIEVPGPLTLFGVYFGQVLTHDVVFSGSSTSKDGSTIDCSTDVKNLECINIPIPKDDKINQDEPFISATRTAALNIDWNCQKTQRDQINQLTHWLDLSIIYGSDEETCNSLRTKKDGLMKTSKIDGFSREFLPTAPSGSCVHETNKRLCFASGEFRPNENFVLNSIQTLFLREHNRIAKFIKDRKPVLTDENIFQEARRIVIAEYQHIIFNEWLPLIIGKQNMESHGLSPSNAGLFSSYNPKLDVQLYNEFTTAAFRFGHSMVKSNYLKKDVNFKTIKSVSLNSITLDPTEAYQDEGLDGICRGAITDKCNNFDAYFTDTIQNHLFEVFGTAPISKRGSLSTLNINRGRDHGLAPYVKYRELFGLPKATKFEDLKEIPSDVIANLKSIYKRVDDIDLYSAGVSEKPLPGAIVGPTFAIQRIETHYYDRHYYENSGFNLHELNEIKKVTMSRIICDNLDVSSVPKCPFIPQEISKFERCSSVAQMDLTKIFM